MPGELQIYQLPAGAGLGGTNVFAVDDAVSHLTNKYTITQLANFVLALLANPYNAVVTNSTTIAMAAYANYIIEAASLCTLTLPTTIPAGASIAVTGYTGGWKIAQNVGQQILMGSAATTSGVAGFLASTVNTDCVVITCVVANTTFVVNEAQGNLTVN